MSRIVVEVMLKPEILDPQGQAVKAALGRLGLTGVSDVRQGKRFVIDVDSPDMNHLHELAGSLLSNPVIEDYTIVAACDCPCGECRFDAEGQCTCDCSDCDCDCCAAKVTA